MLSDIAWGDGYKDDCKQLRKLYNYKKMIR